MKRILAILAAVLLSSSASANPLSSDCRRAGIDPVECAAMLQHFNRAVDRHLADRPAPVQHGNEGSARDRAWVAECNPRIVTDREGIRRYVYSRPRCENGQPR